MSDQVPPFRGLLDVIESQYVDVIALQGRQDRAEFGRGVGRGPGAELDADDERLPPRAEGRDSLADAVHTAERVGLAGPV